MAMKNKSIPSRIFDICNGVFLFALALTCVLPLVNLAAISFSDTASTAANKVTFWPIGFNIDAYVEVFRSSGFVPAFMVSVARTTIGTIINVLLVIITAYPLSRESKELKGRTFIMWFYVFTMMFSGGLIPYFIVVNKVGLLNNFWVMIIPGAVSVYNTILMMNFFRGLPQQLYEAAVVDGAGHFTILVRIYVPLSTASIATIALFSMVGHWNDWFTGLIFLNKDQFPLQTYLRQMLEAIDYSSLKADDVERIKKLNNRTFRAAQLFLATIPILCVYPFLQKYFVKGLTLGSVKE